MGGEVEAIKEALRTLREAQAINKNEQVKWRALVRQLADECNTV